MKLFWLATICLVNCSMVKNYHSQRRKLQDDDPGISIAPIFIVSANGEQLPVPLSFYYQQYSNSNFTPIFNSGEAQGLSIDLPNYFSQVNAFNVSQQQENPDLVTQFCPYAEYSPLYQPVYFYLSPYSLSMANMNSSQMIMTALVFNDGIEHIHLICFSIVPMERNIIGLDCNLNGTNTSVFQMYLILFNDQTSLMENYTLLSEHKYEIFTESLNATLYLSYCSKRITQRFSVVGPNGLLAPLQLVFCPSDMFTYQNQSDEVYYQGQIFIYNTPSKFFSTNKTPEITKVYSMFALNFQNLNGCSQFAKSSQVFFKQIYSNQNLFNNFQSTSWNLLFVMNEMNGVCKCSFQYSLNLSCIYIEIQCIIILLLLLQVLQPVYFNVVNFIRDEAILLIGSNESIYMVSISNDVETQNNYIIMFKDLYENESYTLVDSAITSEYIVITLSQNNHTYNNQIIDNQQLLQHYCLNHSIGSNSAQNLIKTFDLIDVIQAPLLELYINPSTIMFEDSSIRGLGNRYYSYDYKLRQFSTFKINQKMAYISFNSQEPFQNYIPYIIQMQVNYSFEPILTKNESMIICVVNSFVTQPTLLKIAQFYNSSDNLTELIDACPSPQDELFFDSFLIDFDLRQGAFGPLLQFIYMPRPLNPQFYPFYFNNIYQIEFKKEFANWNKVFTSILKTSYSAFNSLASLQIICTNSLNPNILYNRSYLLIQNYVQSITPFAFLNISADFQSYSIIVEADNGVEIDFYEQFENIVFIADYKMGKQRFIKLSIKDYSFVSHNFLISALIQSGIIIIQFIYNITQNLLDGLGSTSEILQFAYGKNEQLFLMILLNTSDFFILTQGFLGPYQQFLTNFSLITFKTNMLSYTNSSENNFLTQGFSLIDQMLENLILAYWASGGIYDESYLLEFLVFSPYEIKYTRSVPLYNSSIDFEMPVVVSSGFLYVPIRNYANNYYDYKRIYYIFNLFKETPNVLYQQFEFDSSKNNSYPGFVAPIENQMMSTENFLTSSFVLVVAEDQLFINYQNVQSNFVTFFNRNSSYEQLIMQEELMIIIFQPNEVASLYRNYAIHFNISEMLIESQVSEQQINLTSQVQDYYTQSFQIGVFFYQFIIQQQEAFKGPILSYSYVTKGDIKVLTQEYAKINKYLGQYYQTINQYGEVFQMVSLSEQNFPSLFLDSGIQNVMDYNDLIIVVTNQFLIFLQKESIKNSNLLNNCDYLYDYKGNSSQYIEDNKTWHCDVRIVYTLRMASQLKNPVYCRIIMNTVSQFLITYYQEEDNGFSSQYLYIDYSYSSKDNQILIYSHDLIYYSYSYNAINDFFIPLRIDNITYQFMMHSLFIGSNEFGIAIFNVDNNSHTLQVQIVQTYLFGINDKTFTDLTDFDVCRKCFSDSDLITVALVEGICFFSIILIVENLQILLLNDQKQGFTVNQSWKISKQSLLESRILDQGEEIIFFFYIEFLPIIQPFASISLLVGIGKQFLILNLSLQDDNNTYDGAVNYRFVMYSECSLTKIRQPEIYFDQNGQIQYLIATCLAESINYNTIFEQILQTFDYPNSNLIFVQLMIKSPNNQVSWPILVNTPFLMSQNSFESAVLSYVIYHNDFDNSIHFIISNSSYFLIDYFIYPFQEYTLLVADKSKNEDLSFTLVARNGYTYSTLNFSIFIQESSSIKDSIWFYVLIAILLIFFILIILFVFYAICTRKKVWTININNSKQDNRHGEKEIQMEENKQDDLFASDLKRQKAMSQGLWDDAIKQILGNVPNKKESSGGKSKRKETRSTGSNQYFFQNE